MQQILIGPLPPPIGGVSNYILRYSLKNNTSVQNERTVRKIKNAVKIILLRDKEIHVHTASWFVALLLVIKSKVINRGCRYYFVNHNFQIVIKSKKTIIRKIQQIFRFWFITRCEKVYVVNQDLIPRMESIYGNLNYAVLDPFIPPDENKEIEILGTYSDDIEKFMKEHSPVISSCAWKISFHNGEDLYGLDLIIELIAALKKSMPKVGLVFFIGDDFYNAPYLESCFMKIQELGISEQIKFETGQKEFWPALKRSDLFIRATNTDGDPLSIKEAVYFGVEVLASDCTSRISGVNIFKSRDTHSLTEEAIRILEKLN